MSSSVSAVASYRSRQNRTRVTPHQYQIALCSACSLVVLAVGVVNAQPQPPGASDKPSAEMTPEFGVTFPPSGFVAGSRRTLKRLHEKMAALGVQVLEGIDVGDYTEADVASQSLIAESAKARHQQALLNQEAAVIALKDYKNNVFKRDKELSETEIRLSQTELENAERAVPHARERYTRFKQVQTSSAANLARRWHFETGESDARRQEKVARLALEQAQLKLKVLVEFEKRKRETELMSSLMKANADELASKAGWSLEDSRLLTFKKMQDPAWRRFLLRGQRKQTLVLVDRTIPIEEQLSERLDQIKPGTQQSDSLRGEITGLMRQLQGFVDQAEAGETAAALARLKSRLGRSVVAAAATLSLGSIPYTSHALGAGREPHGDSKEQARPAAVSSEFMVEVRAKLNKLQEEILDLGAQTLSRDNTAGSGQPDVTSQEIKVKSEEANVENAKLTREIAEIAVVGYEEGTFKQDQAVAEGQVKLAQISLEKARASIEVAESRLAKIKQASRGTAEDLSLEYSNEDSVVQAVLREPRARLELEKAQSRLELLRRFAGPIRGKELRSEVEKARSDELAKKAQWEREKLKLEKLREATKIPDRDNHEKQVLTLLDRAISILDELRIKVDGENKDPAQGELFRKEIADKTNQLQTLVEQAQAEEAAAKWAKLKPKVRDAAVRYLGAQAK